MRILVIGGGACGASAAARCRRLNDAAEIIILEATDEISIANCGLPYYTSDVINSRANMIVSSPVRFKNLLNIDVRLNARVTEINRKSKTVTVNGTDTLSYDKLVLATGASPVIPPIAGINNKKIFTVRTLKDGDGIKDILRSGEAKNAVVVGGGFIGVEMAENFIHAGLHTTLVELSDQILAPLDREVAAFAQNKMRANVVELILSDGVKEFEQEYIILNSG